MVNPPQLNQEKSHAVGFWEHMDELRIRLVRCLYVFFAGFVGFYFVSDILLDVLRKPLFKVLPESQRHLYYTGLLENFLVHLKVSAHASLFLLSPLYFVMIWGFVSPGLTQQERKRLRPFLAGAAVFFLVGVSFAYFYLFPKGVQFFMNYGTGAEVPLLTLEAYVDLVLKVLSGFGIAFELPMIIILLVQLGVISVGTLREHRRTAMIIIAGVSALVAPPDALSMVLLMAPLYFLFEAAVFVSARFIGKRIPLDTN